MGKYSMELDATLYYLCRLEILNVDARDMGCYKAVARNASGEGHATINLTFEEGSGGDKPKIPDGIPPRFPKKPSIKQDGDDLILECILEANPLPEITWYRKDKVIKEDARITWECKKGKKNRFLLTLRIKNPTLKDAGMYRCNAFNSSGDSNANIDLKFETEDEAGNKGETAGEPGIAGTPPTFTEKPKIVPNEKGTLVTLKFQIKADPKCEIQWFKGMDKINDSAKYSQKYTALSASNEYEIALEIQDPSADDGGDYKCLVKNDHGQLQAKLNLNIEAEPAVPGKTMDAPTFTEKPKIVTLNEGKLVQLIVRYKASSKCTCSWYYKETLIQQSQSIQVFHEKVDASSYECRLEIKDPGANTAGMYKCLVSNDKGEINANLMLNIQMAQSEVTSTESKTSVTRKTSETTKMSVKKERRRSVILQCAVSGQSDVDIVWKKEGAILETTEQKKTSRYSVEKKASTQNQTIIQLEIMDADVEDKGVYELVAKNNEGETQSQIVELTAEQVKL